jgi:hypothetical protein
MVCIRRVPYVHFQVGKQKPRRVALGGVSFVHQTNNTLTKCSEVISKVISEMICLPRRVVMELYIDDVVCVLVSHFNDSDHVICWCDHTLNTLLFFGVNEHT